MPGIQLILPERPGYGISDPQPQRKMADWADDVTELADALGLETYSVSSSGELWNNLDDLRNRMDAEARLSPIVVGSVTSMASALTVGYVTWLIRGGKILIGVLARLPAWTLVDPLTILATLEKDEGDVDDESLASVVDKSNRNADSTSEVSVHPTDSVRPEPVDQQTAGA
jgi:hypothetical protein